MISTEEILKDFPEWDSERIRESMKGRINMDNEYIESKGEAYEIGFNDGCIWNDAHPHWREIIKEGFPTLNDNQYENWYFVVVEWANWNEAETMQLYRDEDGELKWKNGSTEEAEKHVTHWMPINLPKFG